jgi:hypothetical protein
MKPRSNPRCTVDTQRRLTGPDGRRCVGEITDRGLGLIGAPVIHKGGRIEIGQFANRLDAMRAFGGVPG